MRIRKRLPALSSSSTAPPPLSDLHLRRSEAAPPSSQPPKQTSAQNNRWTFPQYQEKMKQKEHGDDDHVNINNDIRKIVSICHGEEGFNFNTNLQPSSSSLQVLEEADCDQLVPLKKRKWIFERNPNEETASAKMKSKTNKKYGDDISLDRKAVTEEDGITSSSSGSAKKSKRGNVIMEGSRCSRVNGRGWRCCQPTLVGYSLCEHHLGKGRLRSMASARRQQSNEGNPQPLLTKKRSKVGVVKARSMSSLLGRI